MRVIAVIFVVGVCSVVKAACPNGCSGHGTCDKDDQCTCYLEGKILNEEGVSSESLMPQWTGADCSQVVCARGTSWRRVDGIATHEKGRECSDAGICNRVTGECECFPGFEGLGCQRTSCPNDCNGHGVCKSNVQFAETYARAISTAANQKNHNPWCDGVNPLTKEYSAELCERNIDFLDDYYNTYMVSYNGAWDSGLQFGCECDVGFTGPDCGLRECPSKNDVADPTCDGIQMDTDTYQFLDTDDSVVSLSSSASSSPLSAKSKEAYRMYLNLYSKDKPVYNVPELFYASHVHFDDWARACRAPYYSDNWLKEKYSGKIGTAMEALASQPAHLLMINAENQNCGFEWDANNLKVPYCNGKLWGEECSGRGMCNRATGVCLCFDGYAGEACDEVEELA